MNNLTKLATLFSVSAAVITAGVANAESYVTNQWSHSNMHVDSTTKVTGDSYYHGQRTEESFAIKVEPLNGGKIYGARSHFTAPDGFAAATSSQHVNESYGGSEHFRTHTTQRGYVTVDEHRVSAGNN